MAPTAQELLHRILELVPLGARDHGIGVDEAAAALDVDRRAILAAVSILQEGLASLTAGPGDLIQGGIEGSESGGEGATGDRIRFFAPGAFGRPLRLLTAEALALALGMRILAGQVGETRRPRLLEAAQHLEAALATPRAGKQAAGTAEHFALDVADGREDQIRADLLGACRAGEVRCILYLKPGATAPDRREVEPHHLVVAEGAWYLVAWCRGAGAGRSFRLDRILGVEPVDGPRRGPPTLDPADFVDGAGGRVYQAGDDTPVTVRYSPVVARWILEREEGERLPDGGCRITRRVADPRWAVAHVLQYGGDAWIESPSELRDLVRATVQQMLES